MTVAVLGSLTWALASAYGPSSGVGSARALPTDDPCAAVGEQTLAGLDGEVSSWHTSVYSNGCSWTVSLAGEEEVHLHFSRNVPMSEADASMVAELGDDGEDIARDAHELYRNAVDSASEAGYLASEASVVATRDKALGFGDESVLAVVDIDYGYSDDISQRVTFLVREGSVVSRLSVNLSGRDEALGVNEAEDLLADVAADVFG